MKETINKTSLNRAAVVAAISLLATAVLAPMANSRARYMSKQ